MLESLIRLAQGISMFMLIIKLSEFDFSMLQHMQDLCSEMRSLG